MSIGSLQKYGVAEGRALSELRAMAKAAGEECPVFTPPGGETLDQVRSPGACCHVAVDELATSESLTPSLVYQ